MSIKQAIPCLFYPVARDMGMSLTQLLTDAKAQAKVLVATARNYEVGAVIRMTELWCEAAAFGMEAKIVENTFPQLGAPLSGNLSELMEMPVPDIESKVTAPLLEAVRLAVAKLEKPLIVGVTGPYSLSSVLNGSETFMLNCLTTPDDVHKFLQKTTDYLIQYGAAYKALGAAGIMLAEPSAAMISPAMMKEFSNDYVQEIIAALQDERFTIIYHNCGAVNQHLQTILNLPADAFHFGSDVDLGSALQLANGKSFIMGNIDPRLFITATPAQIEQRSLKLLEAYANYNNWIPSTGCDLAPTASMANIMSFVHSTSNYRR